MPRLTDEEVMELLKGDSLLNRARREFSSGSARIEQAGQQRTPLGPVEMRRMEFEVTQRIIDAYCPEMDTNLLASALRKIAPDLMDELTERVAAYGIIEDETVRDLINKLKRVGQ